jgi:hypothetical protein
LTADERVDLETERTHHDYADSSAEMEEESRSQGGTTNLEVPASKKRKMNVSRSYKAFAIWKK